MLKDKELEDLEYELGELQEEICRKRLDLIFDETGLQESEIYIGDWDCDSSPIGFCVYDIVEDQSCDSCVFCGLPYERK